MSSSKRHFTAVIGKKEQGSYVSSSPSSAARKAVSKLCADDKKRKVVFSIRETTRDSNKKIYGPYIGYMQKLDKPVELEGRVIRYKPVAKLDKMKGGRIIGRGNEGIVLHIRDDNIVSKLIKIDDETKIRNLIELENKLNEIDRSGKHHVKMISSRRIIPSNINKIDDLPNEQRETLKKFDPNLEIKYEFGGISFLDFFFPKIKIDFTNNSTSSIFLKNILYGLINILDGLYLFYQNGINHNDFSEGTNIVFFIENPQNMRMIDFQYRDGNEVKNRLKPRFISELNELITISNYLLVTLFKKSKSEIEYGNLSAENVKQEKESIKAKIQAKIDELDSSNP